MNSPMMSTPFDNSNIGDNSDGRLVGHEAAHVVQQSNPTLMTDCDGALQKAKQMHDAADEYDRQAAKLHASGAAAAAMNPGFSSALQMQLNGEQLGQMSGTVAARIRAQADELTRLANETRAGSEAAAIRLRQFLAQQSM